MLTVLFVCTGNICRSPLGQAFLTDRSKKLLDGALTVRSAGTWGQEGNPPTREAMAVAAERGLDIEDYQASPLTAGLIDRADLILAMTREHRDEVVRMAPEARAKTFTLKELAADLSGLPPPSDPDVPDPVGLGVAAYREVAEEIEEAVDVVVRELFGAPETAGASREGE